jgi:NADH dehydrogenase
VSRHRVVVIGSGFGGLTATKALKNAPVDVTMIARTQHHLFQGCCTRSRRAYSPKERLRRPPGRSFAISVDVNLAARYVVSELLGQQYRTGYDSLIVAAGANQSYFGNDHFAEFAPGMKTIDDALEVRGRIVGALELAERTSDPARRAQLLTFTVVGGGPNGSRTRGPDRRADHADNEA